MTWLNCMSPLPGAARHLVCFPHAGGSASVFRSWATAFAGTEVHAVCYPGRAERAAEPYATGVAELAAGAARAIGALADRPVTLFGHSMGAWVAFETARLLERDGVPVSHLIVSSAHAPQTQMAPGDAFGVRGDLSEDALAAALVSLGGTDPELLAHPVLLKLFFPYVAADLRICWEYTCRPGAPLDCPITSIVADSDPLVSRDDATAWSRQTRGAYGSRAVGGGHFYLIERPPLALVQELLSPQAALSRR
ncbi:thioesterase II family protein [Streptomyces sp. NPDC096152]|uniref:thioesterase II family protein n=1 Tax=Streptomyces sp. NPDC096152 TaxID=3366078 RepID=UPI003802E8F3